VACILSLCRLERFAFFFGWLILWSSVTQVSLFCVCDRWSGGQCWGFNPVDKSQAGQYGRILMPVMDGLVILKQVEHEERQSS
jgi:hypothetical protein